MGLPYKDKRVTKDGMDTRQSLFGNKNQILMSDNVVYGRVYGVTKWMDLKDFFFVIWLKTLYTAS